MTRVLVTGGRPQEMARFRAWLVERGAEILPETNPYEIIRVSTCDGVIVAYRNGRGRETWPEPLAKIFDDFRGGRTPRLSPSRRERKKLAKLAAPLAERDGLACWFCAMAFDDLDDDALTIEHLCPKAHGGPDHPSNLVLACEPCNREAGNSSVAEKVVMREVRRARAAGVPVIEVKG